MLTSLVIQCFPITCLSRSTNILRIFRQKWGKKGRKLRNKDPYGCHSDPDMVLNSASTGSSGVIINAGKYSSSGYTRANYAGAKAATPFEGRANNRPVKTTR